jgi:hypothetical protein
VILHAWRRKGGGLPPGVPAAERGASGSAYLAGEKLLATSYLVM